MVGFLQRVPKLGGGWAPCKLSADSVSHMFEVGKAIPEFMTEFIEQGKILNAPHNFQIVPLEYGHSAHMELLFLWDRMRPDALQIPMEFMRASLEADIKNGHHGTMPPRIPADAEALDLCTAIPIAGRKKSKTHLIRRQYPIRDDSHLPSFLRAQAGRLRNVNSPASGAGLGDGRIPAKNQTHKVKSGHRRVRQRWPQPVGAPE